MITKFFIKVLILVIILCSIKFIKQVTSKGAKWACLKIDNQIKLERFKKKKLNELSKSAGIPVEDEEEEEKKD